MARRDRFIRVRVTEDERKAINSACSARGITVTDLVRQAAGLITPEISLTWKSARGRARKTYIRILKDPNNIPLKIASPPAPRVDPPTTARVDPPPAPRPAPPPEPELTTQTSDDWKLPWQR